MNCFDIACPPDSGELGRSTWTYLHSLAAHYPVTHTEAFDNDFVVLQISLESDVSDRTSSFIR